VLHHYIEKHGEGGCLGIKENFAVVRGVLGSLWGNTPNLWSFHIIA